MQFLKSIVSILTVIVSVNGFIVPEKNLNKRADTVYPSSTFGDDSATTTNAALLGNIVGLLGGSKSSSSSAGAAAATVQTTSTKTPSTAALSAITDALISASASATNTKTYAVAATTTPKTSTSTGTSKIDETIVNILEKLPIESIAGVLDELLSKHPQYLDDVLIWLKDTGLLPKAIDFLLTTNIKIPFLGTIVHHVVDITLDLIYSANTTGIFVALDQSGLAYSIVSQFILDGDVDKGILAIAKGLITSGELSFSEIIHAIVRLSKREDFESDVIEYELPGLLKRLADENDIALQNELDEVLARDELYLIEEYTYETGLDLDKRDNIENLLTTIFSSIERSGLLNDTIHTLLTDTRFQEATTSLLLGVFKKFATGDGYPQNLYIVGPLIAGATESGIVPHIFKQLIHDPAIRAALIKDVVSLLKSGKATITSLFKKEDAGEFSQTTYAKYFAEARAQIENGTVSSVTSSVLSSATISSTTVSSTLKSSTSASSSGLGSTASTNFLAGVAAVLGYAVLF